MWMAQDQSIRNERSVIQMWHFRQEMLSHLIKFQAVYQDKVNRLLTRLNDIEDELPELNRKKLEAEAISLRNIE